MVVTRSGTSPDARADSPARETIIPLSLHGAVRANAPDTVEALLQAGADPNDQDDQGLTPLHEAVILYRTEIVEILLKGGADQRIQDFEHGWTPLHYAAVDKMAAIAKILLSDQRTVAEMAETRKTSRKHAPDPDLPDSPGLTA